MTKKLMILLVAVAAAFVAWAETETVGGYTWIYEQNGEESFILGIAETPTGTLSFPAELGGKPVRNLGSMCQYEWVTDEWRPGGYWKQTSSDDFCAGVTGIIIPEGVTNIYDNSFTAGCWIDDVRYRYGWSSLKDVSLPESLVSCHVGHVFNGTPFFTSKTFPEFILSASGTKLWGVKEYEGEYNFFNLVEVVVPATVTDIADYALGRIYIFVTHSNTGYYAMAQPT